MNLDPVTLSVFHNERERTNLNIAMLNLSFRDERLRVQSYEGLLGTDTFPGLEGVLKSGEHPLVSADLPRHSEICLHLYLDFLQKPAPDIYAVQVSYAAERNILALTYSYPSRANTRSDLEDETVIV